LERGINLERAEGAALNKLAGNFGDMKPRPGEGINVNVMKVFCCEDSRIRIRIFAQNVQLQFGPITDFIEL